MLNGQVVPGLNVNNVTGLPQATATATASSRGTTPIPTSQADNSTHYLIFIAKAAFNQLFNTGYIGICGKGL